jgi:hypothetical protein
MKAERGRSDACEHAVHLVGERALPSSCKALVGVSAEQQRLVSEHLVPIVVFDQIYSFDIDALVQAIPRPEQIAAEQFGPAAEELFMRIMQMADNAGATDEHRALNYLAVRYNAIYALAAERHGLNYALSAVDVRPSRLSGVRRIVDVIFSFTHRQTDVTERYFARIDVTEEFPFLVTRLSPYYVYDRYP